jgi:hypothetical protein
VRDRLPCSRAEWARGAPARPNRSHSRPCGRRGEGRAPSWSRRDPC